MVKWYAWIIDWTKGKGFEIGAWSRGDLDKTLEDMDRTGFADLEKCSVRIYSVEC